MQHPRALPTCYACLSLVLAITAVGCGESDNPDGGGAGTAGQASGGAAGSGGTGGTAGSGGQNAGGTSGGGNIGCPADVPPSYQECDPTLSPASCSYSAQCTAGPASFNFKCSSGHWSLEQQACDKQADRCPGIPVSCNNGDWTYWTGVNPQPTCPSSRPEGGSPCTPNDGECGFFCQDNTTWTVLYCDGASWVSDGACN